MKYKDLYYLHLRHNDAIFTQNNEVQLFTDGKDKFTSLINDLKSAKDHIHLLYYIIRDDALGKEISDILIQKAKADVEVRVRYDDLGSRRLSRRSEERRVGKECSARWST